MVHANVHPSSSPPPFVSSVLGCVPCLFLGKTFEADTVSHFEGSEIVVVPLPRPVDPSFSFCLGSWLPLRICLQDELTRPLTAGRQSLGPAVLACLGLHGPPGLRDRKGKPEAA